MESEEDDPGTVGDTLQTTSRCCINNRGHFFKKKNEKVDLATGKDPTMGASLCLNMLALPTSNSNSHNVATYKRARAHRESPAPPDRRRNIEISKFSVSEKEGVRRKKLFKEFRTSDRHVCLGKCQQGRLELRGQYRSNELVLSSSTNGSFDDNRAFRNSASKNDNDLLQLNKTTNNRIKATTNTTNNGDGDNNHNSPQDGDDDDGEKEQRLTMRYIGLTKESARRQEMASRVNILFNWAVSQIFTLVLVTALFCTCCGLFGSILPCFGGRSCPDKQPPKENVKNVKSSYW